MKTKTIASGVKKKQWVVYMLELSNGAYYTGITDDLKKRLKVHASGAGSKLVRAHLPFELVYEALAGKTRSDAQKIEAAIKKLPRCDKLELIKFCQFLKALDLTHRFDPIKQNEAYEKIYGKD